MSNLNFLTYFPIMIFGGIALQYGWIAILKKHHIAQYIKAYGPARHMEEKANTPTMGGIVFLVLFVGSIFFCKMYSKKLLFFSLFPLGMGGIGLFDDWLKYNSSSSEGFTSVQKFLAQIIFCLSWIFLVYSSQPFIFTPFSRILDIGITLFLGVGIVNAVNVTDGLDGLATSCLLASFLVLGGFSLFSGNQSSFLFAFWGIGISLSFLWHNAYPASVFMGDVGSHFFGALLFITSVSYDNPWILLPASSIFAVEILSVILQLGAIYGMHRKIFAMSPLHHHFELKNVHENQIVLRFVLMHVFLIFMILTICSKCFS